MTKIEGAGYLLSGVTDYFGQYEAFILKLDENLSYCGDVL